MVVAAAVLELVAWPETFSVSEWIAAYIGTLLLVAERVALTLLRLRGDQRTAGLVVITLFALWSLYFPVQELVAPRLYLESSVWFAEIVSVALTLLACFVAQFGPSPPAAVDRSSRSVRVGDLGRPDDREPLEDDLEVVDQALPRASWVRVK